MSTIFTMHTGLEKPSIGLNIGRDSGTDLTNVTRKRFYLFIWMNESEHFSGTNRDQYTLATTKTGMYQPFTYGKKIYCPQFIDTKVIGNKPKILVKNTTTPTRFSKKTSKRFKRESFKRSWEQPQTVPNKRSILQITKHCTRIWYQHRINFKRQQREKRSQTDISSKDRAKNT